MKAIGLQKKQRPIESRDGSMRIENPQQINQEKANPWLHNLLTNYLFGEILIIANQLKI